MNLEADLVVFNGNIITMDPENPHATAIAVKNYKIIIVGQDNDVLELVQSARRVIDLGGKTVVPGFIDAHTHITSAGIRKELYIDLSATRSKKETLEILKTVAAETKPGQWILGQGWDESKWPENEYITAKDLDEVSQKHPILVNRVDSHLASTNTLGMKKLNVPVNHEGVLKDKKGRLIGVFRDVEDLRDKIPISPEQIRNGVIMGSRLANQHGITTVVDNINPKYALPISECEREGLLTARFVINPPAEQLKHMVTLGILSGSGSPMLRRGGVKIFVDGSIGARTAALNEPYRDDPKNTGRMLIEPSKFNRLVRNAVKNGIQTVTHAIGDRAIELVLQTFEGLSEKEQAKARLQRHRIEHAEMMNRDQIRRAAAIGLILSMQPNFVAVWQQEGGMYEQRLGKERTDTMNMFRVALDNGARVCFGSDGMPYGPIYGIWAATTHPNPNVRITAEEAMRCYTLEGAYSVFMERTVGSISVGKRADFVILSNNILKVRPEDIKDIRIESTFVGGREEFSHARNRGV